METLRLPNGVSERPEEHRVTWPKSFDLAVSDEIARRMRKYQRSYPGMKSAIVRDALRVYLGSTMLKRQRRATAVGKQLRQAREDAKMSLRMTADAADLSASAVSQIESGVQLPTLRALTGLAKALVLTRRAAAKT
jgi:DNA-binding XRE family transcriptional regulator